MANTQRPRHSARPFVTRQVDDEILILDQEGEKVHQLNSTACLIWHACDGERTIEDIVGLVQKNFTVDAQRIETDVRAVLDELTTLGLIEYVD